MAASGHKNRLLESKDLEFQAMMRILPLVLIPVLLLSLPVLAGPAQSTGEPDTDWSFTTKRSVKAIVVGGSIAAFTGMGFGQQLQSACRNLEVANIAKARLSAAGVRKRFEAQVLKNPNIDRHGSGERWVLLQGGLNSVGNPTKTNADLMGLIRLAHQADFKVFGLTLSPWGRESDTKRWAGINGLKRQDNTRKAVDFVMGRLSPAKALGRHIDGRKSWRPGDLPDRAVDLYDSALRDHDAKLRPSEPLQSAMTQDPEIEKRIMSMPQDQQAAERQRLLQQAREIPRWYLRPDLHSFDSIHPNREGHRIIAYEVCKKAPESWGCDCNALSASNTPRSGSK